MNVVEIITTFLINHLKKALHFLLLARIISDNGGEDKVPLFHRHKAFVESVMKQVIYEFLRRIL